jgi:hypothetical protein
MAVSLLDYDTFQFDAHDGGQTTQAALMLATLVELRVISGILLSMNQGLIGDDLNQLRVDAVNDPASLPSTFSPPIQGPTTVRGF